MACRSVPQRPTPTVQLKSTVATIGTIAETPTTLTAKPIQTGDAANNVAQRVMFDVNKNDHCRRLTVAMADQKLYGYITKGQSTALPHGMTIQYSSDRPDVVSVSQGQVSVLRAVGAGPATITVTVRYHGQTATGTFVVDVQ